MIAISKLYGESYFSVFHSLIVIVITITLSFDIYLYNVMLIPQTLNICSELEKTCIPEKF